MLQILFFSISRTGLLSEGINGGGEIYFFLVTLLTLLFFPFIIGITRQITINEPVNREGLW